VIPPARSSLRTTANGDPRSLLRPGVLLCAMMLAAALADAQAPLAVPPLDLVPESYFCHRAGSPVAVDGRLEEPAWKAATWSNPFVDIQGSAQPRPRFATRMKMIWDDSCLYVGAWLEEPHVWATITKRDEVIFHDPDFEVFIDPDGDNHQYYEFEINAFNTGWDLRLVKPYRDGGPPVDSWNIAGLATAVRVAGTPNDPRDTDSGWCVELAFPWKALGEFAQVPAPPRIGDVWRLNFSRVEWQVEIRDGKYVKVPGQGEDNWVWSAQGVVDMHRPEMWGFVQFEGPPGTPAALRSDPSREARCMLMAVYYAQREYRRLHGAWAARTEDLGPHPPGPEITLTADGYEASCPFIDASGRPARVFIRQDSFMRLEPQAGR
jgi:hypothetical protein